MPPLRLTPTIDTLRQEYVLVQAWKKAHDYVRGHNWYADVLELDLSNTRLSSTLRGLQDELKNHQALKSSLARLVLAPKSTPWEIRRGEWRPKKGKQQKIRPLACTAISSASNGIPHTTKWRATVSRTNWMARCYDAQRPKLSDPAHRTGRLQLKRESRVR